MMGFGVVRISAPEGLNEATTPQSNKSQTNFHANELQTPGSVIRSKSSRLDLM
jgi:hypothetical protein